MQNNELESQSGLKLISLLTFIFAFGLFTVLGSNDDIPMNLDNSATIAVLKIIQGFSVLIIFVLPAVLFSVFWTKPGIHYLGITSKPSFSSLLISGLLMLLSLPLINWLADINQHLKLPEMLNGIEIWMKNSEEKAKVLTDAFTEGDSLGVLFLNLIVIALLAALSEELFFRGVLQKVLIECTRNKHLGVWIGAIIFSAFHMQFYGFLPRMLMGAFLGYLFLWSGSLWLGIFAHFINNGMAVLIIWLINKNVIPENIEKVGIQSGEWIYAVMSLLILITGLLLVYKKESKKNTLLAIKKEDTLTP